MSTKPQPTNELFDVIIPANTHLNALRHASQAGVDIVRYFQTGHDILFQLARSGGLRAGNVIRMAKFNRPITEVRTPSTPQGKFTVTNHRLVVDLSPYQAAEAQGLISASSSKSRASYAIANLDLLNGLVEMRDTINRNLPVQFSVIRNDDESITKITTHLAEGI